MKFLAILPIDPLPDDGDYTKGWRRHCTVLQPFNVPHEQIEALQAGLADIARSTAPVHLESVGEDRYGPDRSVPVHVIKRTRELLSLHRVVLQLAENLGGFIESPEWAGEGYSPHVAIRNGSGVEVGTTHVAAELGLITYALMPAARGSSDARKVVLGSFPFG